MQLCILSISLLTGCRDTHGNRREEELPSEREKPRGAYWGEQQNILCRQRLVPVTASQERRRI